MIAKLPRWVWSGAWALAFVAGFVNVIGLLGFEHQAVTHLTGTTWSFRLLGYSALFIPSALTTAIAVSYGLFRILGRFRAKA